MLVFLCKGVYNNSVIGVSPSGKATDSDSVIRVFESLHPSQKSTEYICTQWIFFLAGSK